MSFSSIVYYAVFSVRRFDLIIINQYLSQKSPLSGVERSLYLEKITLFLIVQTYYLSYIHTVKPHNDPNFNSLEFINEYALCGCGYTMILFTKFY